MFSTPITDDLDWGQHISEISAKATKTMGFLRHNLAFATRHTKEVAYKTLVRSKLEYAALFNFLFLSQAIIATDRHNIKLVTKCGARQHFKRLAYVSEFIQ